MALVALLTAGPGYPGSCGPDNSPRARSLNASDMGVAEAETRRRRRYGEDGEAGGPKAVRPRCATRLAPPLRVPAQLPRNPIVIRKLLALPSFKRKPQWFPSPTLLILHQNSSTLRSSSSLLPSLPLCPRARQPCLPREPLFRRGKGKQAATETSLPVVLGVSRHRNEEALAKVRGLVGDASNE